MKWIDLLTPSAAALALLVVLALLVQSIRQWRTVKRLEGRLEEREGAAARVSLTRIQELQSRPHTSFRRSLAVRPSPRRTGAWIGALVVVALLAGGAWYLFVRDDGSAATSSSRPRAATRTPAARLAAAQATSVVPANPKPLPLSRAAYTVLVLNGSGVPGAARTVVVPLVQDAGYSPAQPENASSQNEKTSFVLYLRNRPDGRLIAENVAKDLGIKRIFPNDGYPDSQVGDADAIVVVGRDLAAGRTP
ncbi:MAG TPA: LytR C-terminal domain-containing protein [Miltoncostaeaceae bacterium]|nr:LytR C-terminal domain-containing protein [Miltoncostaeaceae bacterium]